MTSRLPMTSRITAALGALALLALATPAPATAGDITAGDIVVSNAWTRVTPPGAKVAGGFLTITNKGKTAERLLGGSADIAGRIEVHEMTMEGGVMKMRELPKGLEIAPGASVTLKPGGYHVMFMDLKASPAMGTPVKGTLKFEKAGEAQIAYDVAPLGAKSADGKAGAGHDPAGMAHGKMNNGKH